MNSQLKLMPGSLVQCRGQNAVVVDFIDLTTVLVECAEAGQSVPVNLSELSSCPLEIDSAEASRLRRLAEEALPQISDRRWREARERLDVLRPILLQPKHFRELADVRAAAEKLHKSVPTIYRWLERYESTQSIRALLRVNRNDKDKLRLDPALERIISEAIATEYLAQKKSPATVAELVQKRCHEAGLKAPHPTTIGRRIRMLDPQATLRAREGKKAAKEKYGMQRGQYPDVEYPLAHAQIDHTPADYCLVDEVHRKPLDGSPTLTICIDVHTRCILGFSLSLEAPSVRVAGECIIHAVLRKERFMRDLQVEAEWPCYGVFSVVMTDNASEFEAPDFVRACNAWGIEVRKRPKGAPNYAGLVESTFRTYLKKIHELEGGRQPGKGQRSLAYDIQGRPIMTLSEFRRWMTIFITKYYHQKPHSGLRELPPIEAWRRGILGWGDRKGIGLPNVITDELKLRIDFLRSERRTVQDYGIKFANHSYGGDILRNWVAARDPDNPKLARKFVIKYDPWDISEIYFLDPLVGSYFPLQTNARLDHITLWENEQIGQRQRAENRGAVNEALIFEGLDEMREQAKTAAKSTRSARRQQQRMIESQRFSVRKRRQESVDTQNTSLTPIGAADEDDGPLVPLPGAKVSALTKRDPIDV